MLNELKIKKKIKQEMKLNDRDLILSYGDDAEWWSFFQKQHKVKLQKPQETTGFSLEINIRI